MSFSATFIHLTDTHVSGAGVALTQSPRGPHLPDIPAETKNEFFDRMLERLATSVAGQAPISAVIYTGDAQDKGASGGHEFVFDTILRHLGPRGVDASNIVAVPGNHDVLRGSKPGSPERYESFLKVWRDRGCITPWIDKIDGDSSPPEKHRLLAPDGSWAIYPINTSNWCHVDLELGAELKAVWGKLGEVPGLSSEERSTVAKQLNELLRHDVARVSSEQLEYFRRLLNEPTSGCGKRLSVVAMHHHLREPGVQEDLKTYSTITNLDQVRRVFREQRIDAVLHGHKHEEAVFFETVPDAIGKDDHRYLVISGGTILENNLNHACRLLAFSGLPYAPRVAITSLAASKAGLEADPCKTSDWRLWRTQPKKSSPMVVHGVDFDEVYARACDVASHDFGGTLIVHLDLPPSMVEIPLPSEYPIEKGMDTAERNAWVRDLVSWWQRDRTVLNRRVAHAHGSRLHRYADHVDQIERIGRLLAKKSTTRALAVLIDPIRDFKVETGDKGLDEEVFASFCLVQFRIRKEAGGLRYIDAVAYYRAQEFSRWWPINVAEIRHLQQTIGSKANAALGLITTIAADARINQHSPVQVSIAVVDRWLDEAPHKLFLVVDALARKKVENEEQRKAIRGWSVTLSDLDAAVQGRFNADGVPVPVDGLRTMVDHLHAIHDDADPDLSTFSDTLAALAEVDLAYEQSGKDKPDNFEKWKLSAKPLISQAKGFSANRLDGTNAWPGSGNVG